MQGHRRVPMAALSAALALVLGACTWSQYRGNGRHSGVSPYAPGVTLAGIDGLTPGWTSSDHGFEPSEVVIRDRRAFAPGATALWALDLVTGADRWHADRTFGHQSNAITAASTWSSGGHGIVAMNQGWADSISGTPYFQNIGRVTQLDATTGATLLTEEYAGPVPPLEADGWVYFPRDLIVAAPASLGGSTILIELVARPLAPGAVGFSVPLSSGVQVIFDVASDGTNLHVRTRSGLLTIPAHGCGAPTCDPIWTDQAGDINGPSKVAIAGDTVVTVNGTSVKAFATAGCHALSCPPTWTASLAYGATGLAVTGDRVYVSNGPVLSAFATAGCGATTCAPRWTSTATGTLTAPSVANDVVLAGTSTGDLDAWSVDGCGTATCPVHRSKPQGAAVGPITAIDHALLFTVGGTVRKLVAP